MKNNTILTLFIAAQMLLYLQAHSQQSTLDGVNDINRNGDVFSQQIVSYGDTTYILSKNQNHFEVYKVEAGIGVELPSEFIVNDFKVFDNQIYFCGRNVSGRGFLIKSTLTDLFHGNYFLFENINESFSIDKMQVYKLSNSVNIVCIGTNTRRQSIFLHYVDDSTAAYNIYQSRLQEEIFDDLLLLDKHIVIASRESATFSPFFILRIYEKNNVNSYRHLQCYNGLLRWGYRHKILATPTRKNFIAVVGELIDRGNNIITGVSFINPLDGSPIINTHSYGNPPYTGYIGEYRQIKDIAYSKPYDKLLVLESRPFSCEPSPVQPYSQLVSAIVPVDHRRTGVNGYFIDMIYSCIHRIGHKFNSLIEVAPSTFRAAGINPHSSEIEIWEAKWPQMNGNCNSMESTPVSLCESLSRKISPTILNRSNNLQWKYSKNNKINIIIKQICN